MATNEVFGLSTKYIGNMQKTLEALKEKKLAYKRKF